MVDRRFHISIDPVNLRALLHAAGLQTLIREEHEGLELSGAEELHLAGPEHVSLAAQPEYRSALQETKAGVVIVSQDLLRDVPETSLAIAARDPHRTFIDLVDQLYPATRQLKERSWWTKEDGTVLVEADVRLGPGVVLGKGVEIGRGTVIGPNSVIGAGVTIGRNCSIGPNCTVECAYLGNNIVLHAGVRIGTEGFGWLDHGRSNRKIPQLGRVILQDKVEIGANSAVDRGALGDTVVGEGTKIDNLVQIGHNCRIGRNCLIAGTAALAGSTIVEDSVMFGGGAASAGHLTIGRGSILALRAVVTKDLPPGSRVAGYPAQDARAWRREVAAVRRLNKRSESGR